MLVVIAGGGRTGSHLASRLLAQGHSARLIEAQPDTLVNLHRDLPTEIIFEGDPTDPATLVAAGIERANVLAAVTSADADNLIIASLARFQYSVRRIIGRVNHPRNASLFTPSFGVIVCLNQADIVARLIEEEMSLGDITVLPRGATVLEAGDEILALVDDTGSRGPRHFAQAHTPVDRDGA